MLQPFCSFFVGEKMNGGSGRTDFLDSVDRVFDVVAVTVKQNVDAIETSCGLTPYTHTTSIQCECESMFVGLKHPASSSVKTTALARENLITVFQIGTQIAYKRAPHFSKYVGSSCRL